MTGMKLLALMIEKRFCQSIAGISIVMRVCRTVMAPSGPQRLFIRDVLMKCTGSVIHETNLGFGHTYTPTGIGPDSGKYGLGRTIQLSFPFLR